MLCYRNKILRKQLDAQVAKQPLPAVCGRTRFKVKKTQFLSQLTDEIAINYRVGMRCGGWEPLLYCAGPVRAHKKN